MSSPPEARFMERAFELALDAVQSDVGGPFGAVIVRDGGIVASGQNRVTSLFDPTAHAEVVAIRSACKQLETYRLSGCELYTSCEPCPMCLSAAYWARVDRIVYAGTREDAARAGFDDAFFYSELERPIAARTLEQIEFMRGSAAPAFEAWIAKPDRELY